MSRRTAPLAAVFLAATTATFACPPHFHSSPLTVVDRNGGNLAVGDFLDWSLAVRNGGCSSGTPAYLFVPIELTQTFVSVGQGGIWDAATRPAAAPAVAAAPAARLPLALGFEPTAGAGSAFVAHAGDAMLLLTPDEVVLTGPAGRLGLRFVNRAAGDAPLLIAGDEQPGRSHYLIGKDPARWRRNVPRYASVRYQDVYPCIDAVFHGNEGRVEYDLVLAAGADPGQIALTVEGADDIDIGPGGDLSITRGGVAVVQKAPVVYAGAGGARRAVAGAYVRRDKDTVGFEIAAYDRGRPLVIDPVLSYATFLGSSGQDWSRTVAVDAAGNVYIAANSARDTDFPVKNALYPTPRNGSGMVVVKLDPTLTSLVYSTYLGGDSPALEQPLGIAAAPDGSAFVFGTTNSIAFPTTPGAFQSSPRDPLNLNGDGFVTRLAPDGSSLIYSTYLGGSGAEGYGTGSSIEGAIAVDPMGYAYVTSNTSSLDFPVVRALQPLLSGPGDAFVTKLNPSGTAAVYSTYLGGSGSDDPYGIAADAAGNAYLTGHTTSLNFPLRNPIRATGEAGDAFVTKLDSGGALAYSTYLGGSGNDWGQAIAADAAGNAYVTGYTTSADFPKVNAYLSAPRGGFVTKLGPAGTIVYSTNLLGVGRTIAVDALGRACSAALTGSRDLDVEDAVQPLYGGAYDAYVSCLIDDGSNVLFATYLGGSGMESDGTLNRDGTRLAFDPAGRLIVSGTTSSSDFPVTPSPLQAVLKGSTELYLARITPDPGGNPAFRVTPARGGNGGRVTVSARRLQGPGFLPGAMVRLYRGGYPDLPAEAVTVAANGQALRATFDLAGVAEGAWSLEVKDLATTRSRVFTVEPEAPEQPWVDILGRTRLRAGSPRTYLVTLGNRGNENLAMAPLWIGGIPADATWTLDTTVAEPPDLGLGPLAWTGVPIHLARSGEILVPVYLPVLPPGVVSSLSLTLSVPSNRTFTLRAFMSPPWSRPPMTPEALSCWAAMATDASAAALLDLLGKQLPASCAGAVAADVESLFSETLPLGEAQSGPPLIESALETLVALVHATGACGDAAFRAFPPVALAPHAADALVLLSDPATALPECRAAAAIVATKTKTIVVSNSEDPNAKLGADGSGVERWLSGTEPLRYVIDFENLATASLPAREVVVSDHLAMTWLDGATLRFGEIAIGSHRATLSAAVADFAFAADVDLRPAQDLLVHVDARFERPTGMLTWKFSAIDPVTGLPPLDPLIGFLPPNTSPPAGQGYVAFSVTPKPGVKTGTAVANQATVVFDANPPIDTAAWTNTIDDTPPVSAVAPLAAASACRFDVSWSGSDAGAGIRDYDVFVAEDGRAFASWLVRNLATSGTYLGRPGHRYDFYSVATDLAGNRETAPSLADATTVVSGASATPASVGNTLRLTKEASALRCRFTAVPSAADYVVFEDPRKEGGFATEVAIGSDGAGGIAVPSLPVARLYRIAARSACGDLGGR